MYYSRHFEYAHEVTKFLRDREKDIEIIAITQCCTGYTVFYKE